MSQFGKASAKRSKPSYVNTIVGVALVLFLFGLVGWLFLNLKKSSEIIRENIQVHAWVAPSASKKQIDTLQHFIAALPYVKSYEYVTKEDAIKKLDEITPLANAIKKMKNIDKQTPVSQISSPVTTSTTSNKSEEKKITNIPSTNPNASMPSIPQVVPEVVAAAQSPAGGKGLSGDTTISLTGSGTGYSTAEGPIDMGFKSKRQPAGKFKGIEVWGPYDPPGQLGIWGTDVCVDFDICISDGACIDACPVNVYEWLDTPGHPASEKKPFMIREKDCIFCLACENVCPPQAIKIFVKK